VRPTQSVYSSLVLVSAFTLMYAGSALLFAVALHMPSIEFIAVSAALAGVLVCLSVIDVQTFTLPNKLTGALSGAGLVVTYWRHSEALIAHLGAALAGYLLLLIVAICYRRWRHREGLGLGDAKLFAAAGAWVGPALLPSVLLIATASALLTAIMQIFLRRENISEPFAFGPYLALGLWLTWLYNSSA
jgi:leader peptidase (prepilin peptidase)/N-methyltransferase